MYARRIGLLGHEKAVVAREPSLARLGRKLALILGILFGKFAGKVLGLPADDQNMNRYQWNRMRWTPTLRQMLAGRRACSKCGKAVLEIPTDLTDWGTVLLDVERGIAFEDGRSKMPAHWVVCRKMPDSPKNEPPSIPNVLIPGLTLGLKAPRKAVTLAPGYSLSESVDERLARFERESL